MEHISLSRRGLVRFMLLTGVTLIAPSWLYGCGTEADPSETRRSTDTPASTDGEAADSQTGSREFVKGFETPILVAYYSATGHTAAAAEAIAETLSASLWEIVPENPYTPEELDYNNPDSRVSREHAADGPDTIVALEQDRPDSFASYHTVFIGYPIWWGEASWVVNAFIKHNKFSGKTVVPFCTSASSPIGSSATNLAQRCGTGIWLAGTRFESPVNTRAVEQWVESIGYNH